MEKARYNTEPFPNLSQPLNNVKPSNFWGSHQNRGYPERFQYVSARDALSDEFQDGDHPAGMLISECPFGCYSRHGMEAFSYKVCRQFKFGSKTEIHFLPSLYVLEVDP